jgi:hypothetical protein
MVDDDCKVNEGHLNIHSMQHYGIIHYPMDTEDPVREATATHLNDHFPQQ